MNKWSLALAATIALTGFACSADLTSGPEASPARTGVVISSHVEESIAYLTVSTVERVDGGETPVVVGLAASTEAEVFLQSPASGVQAASITDLEPGDRIRFEVGPVMLRSSPPAYSAVRIWILRP